MMEIILIISLTQLCATPISINFSVGPSWGQSLTLLLSLVFGVPIEATVQQQHSNRLFLIFWSNVQIISYY